MNSEKRNTFPFKLKDPETKILKNLSSKLTTIKRNDFKGDYGEIFHHLIEKMDLRSIITLAQFYDPPICCFTFSDFQLASTLKEFKRILGWTLKKHNPFAKLEKVPTLENIYLDLGIDMKGMIANLDTKGSLKGFSRKFLESQAMKLEKAENWKGFSVVLALLIYGILLFLMIDSFVDNLDIEVIYKQQWSLFC